MSSIICQPGRQKKSLQNRVDDPEMAFLALFALPADRFSDPRASFDPQLASNPVFTFLEILSEFNLKINLFLSFTAILFNSYFKEKGLSRILVIFFEERGRGFKESSVCLLGVP
jgi:hypothetical protein